MRTNLRKLWTTLMTILVMMAFALIPSITFAQDTSCTSEEVAEAAATAAANGMSVLVIKSQTQDCQLLFLPVADAIKLATGSGAAMTSSDEPAAPATDAEEPATPSTFDNATLYPGKLNNDDLFDNKEAAMSLCPTDQQMMKETGVTRQIETKAPGDWETCKWQVILDGAPFDLPVDGSYTAKMMDGTHQLFVGPAHVENSMEGTLRLARGYVPESYVMEACSYAKHEVGYADTLRDRTNGEDNIKYALANFTCPALQGVLHPSKAQTMNAAPQATTEPAQCPVSADDASSILGGDASGWAQSPDDSNQWIYSGGWTSDDVQFTYPGYGWFDWWKRDGEQVREAFPVDNATFHCQ